MMFSSTLTDRPIFWTFLRLLGLASSRALVRGLALCLLHSEAHPCWTSSRPLALLTRVDSRRLLGLCHPVSHGPDSSWDLSSRAPPDSTKRARSTRSFWSWLAFITMYSTLRVLQRGHFSIAMNVAKTLFSRYASNSAVSLFVKSESWGCLMCLSHQTTRHHLLALKHEIVLVLHSSLY